LVSEPHAKLVRHLEQFEFFDAQALGETIEFIHLPALLDAAAAEGTTLERAAAVQSLADEIVRASAEEERSVTVIDGIKALRDYAEGHGFGFRGVAYDLASKVAHSRAVLVFVGEYTTEEVAYAPEFAVADGIIYLADEPFGRFDQRWLRVLKLRGTDFLDGQAQLPNQPRRDRCLSPLRVADRVAQGTSGRTDVSRGRRCRRDDRRRPAYWEHDLGGWTVGIRQDGARVAVRRRRDAARRAEPLPLVPAES